MWDVRMGGTNIIKILYILYTMLVTFMFLLFFSGGLVNHTINVSVAHNTFLISLYFFKKNIYKCENFIRIGVIWGLKI